MSRAIFVGYAHVTLPSNPHPTPPGFRFPDTDDDLRMTRNFADARGSVRLSISCAFQIVIDKRVSHVAQLTRSKHGMPSVPPMTAPKRFWKVIPYRGIALHRHQTVPEAVESLHSWSRSWGSRGSFYLIKGYQELEINAHVRVSSLTSGLGGMSLAEVRFVFVTFHGTRPAIPRPMLPLANPASSSRSSPSTMDAWWPCLVASCTHKRPKKAARRRRQWKGMAKVGWVLKFWRDGAEIPGCKCHALIVYCDILTFKSTLGNNIIHLIRMRSLET